MARQDQGKSLNHPAAAAHPTSELDDTVHQRARLGILSILVETRRADFGYIKNVLALSDGNLSRHIDVLATGKLVTVAKGYDGNRPRTWVSITKRGRDALGVEMRAIKELLRRFEESAGDD
jgi:DNA-binding MarR family transcriptional regulator